MRVLPLIKIFSVSLLLVLTTGCVSQSEPNDQLKQVALDTELSLCLNLATQYRQTVNDEDVTNAIAPALINAPLFHQNRFLNHLAKEVETDSQFKSWFDLASTLGKQIRNAENSNLREPWTEQQLQRLSQCAEMLASANRFNTLRRDILSSTKKISDHYQGLPQWLGFNWLLRPIFKWRIKQLHQQEQLWFEMGADFAETVSYNLDTAEAPQADIKAWFARAYEDSPLKLPIFSHSQLGTLFELHAPNFTLELEDENDRIGKPRLIADHIEIDTRVAEVYVLPSYTDFAGVNLLQLNYVVWFSERKPLSKLDLYSGEIDSLIWRVTIDQQGDVLLYDSIHSCGCYHKYFIASDAIKTRRKPLSQEPANVFDLRTDSHQGESMDKFHKPHIWLTANEHYVVDIDFENPVNSHPYTIADYHELSHLKDGKSSKSFFSSSGIIEQSARMERYTLWPTGIESVGAMRQWGTHATGFVEQQQFDDPTLLNDYFTKEP